MASQNMLSSMSSINKMVEFSNNNAFKCDQTCQTAASKAGAAKDYNEAVVKYAGLMDITKNTNLINLQKKYYDSLGSKNYDNMLKKKSSEMWSKKKNQLKSLLQDYKGDILTQLDSLHSQDLYFNKHKKFLDMSTIERDNITEKIEKRKSDKNINNRLSYYYEEKMSGWILLNIILKRIYFSLVIILFIVTFFKQQYRQPNILSRLFLFALLPFVLMPQIKKII
tara:strand:+ start:183 stop:854 length:672 start_codon:yes stop_codon:yes gene_type:complete